MTVDKIIQQALRWADQGQIDFLDLADFYDTYELILDGLLEKHDWVFSYNISHNLSLLTSAQEGYSDLGFRYQYVLSDSTAIDILETDPDAGAQYQSVEEGLRFGVSLDRDDLVSSYVGKKDILFVRTENGGVIHSDDEMTSVAYKRRPLPQHMNPLFRLYLIYSLSAIFASTKDSENLNNYYKLQKRADSACLSAVSRNLRPPTDPHLLAIYNWVSRYITQTYSRY